MSPFQKRFQDARIARGFSLSGLSKTVGCAQSLAGQIERGVVQHPGSETLQKMCGPTGLNVSIDWLMTGVGRGPGGVVVEKRKRSKRRAA